MRWTLGLDKNRGRQTVEFLPRIIDVLETRALLANGITATAGPPIIVAVGTPIANAVFATYTVTDPSGAPGTQWRALINFGDGQIDGPIFPIEKGENFEFVDDHMYKAPGVYTVTVMIAVPESHQPNDNTVTTRVTVTSSTPTSTPMPTPTPTSPPPTPHLVGSGLNSRVRENRTFHGTVARFSEPHTMAQEFQAVIDWGDQSAPTPGVIHARDRGRFAVVGSHHYITPGTYHVAVQIQDGRGQEIVTESLVRVVK